MAFYKLEETGLLEAPSAVESVHYAIYADMHDQYTYPVYGWYWFDTRKEALEFFNLPPE